MIALSDYLDYLNAEVVTARQRADLLSIETARAYAEHEYLKYFRAPRFVMPSVKMEIPVRISEVDQETKYDFDFRPKTFLSDLNRDLRELAARRELLDAPPLPEKVVESRAFQALVTKLDEDGGGFVRDVDSVLNVDEVTKVYNVVFDEVILETDRRYKGLYRELQASFFEALKRQFKPVKTNINSLLVTPEANSTQDKGGELLVRLTVEMEASGIRIRKLEGANGGEEIILDD